MYSSRPPRNTACVRRTQADDAATLGWRSVGRSGLRVSPIGLGMMSFGDPAQQSWALGEEQAEPLVRRAVEAGVTFFDTADVYSDGESERITGRLLARLFASREDYVLATKVFYPTGSGPNDRGLSRKHVMAAIDASLRRLGTDHVDLYQVHRWDEDTPIEETMAALHEIVRAGKARYIGASTMRAWQFAKAQHVAERAGLTPFVAMQDRYNLVNREEEREMIPLCLDQGVGVLPYSPLARGLLAGKRGEQRATARSREDERTYRDADLAIAGTVRDIATERGVTAAQIALAWLLARPGVVAPIIGATRIEHVEDAIAATRLVLTREEQDRLQAPYVPHHDGEFT
jgi:1-deoxyxylulose-5-phosphate synthase